ncbi:alpha/beta hydrolase [Geovibrio thiophilus]|uniref:alpha/beta hydrolase n=1 Tax=Geovibrio thiophilus TaxID=139438 RepID=UPI0013E3DAE6|nr:alpha/beta hydrolase [Geovibrio thiophilus]
MLTLPAGSLHGTLEIPSDADKPPVALIIAGSGPTDRDGNSRFAGRNDSLKQLAKALEKNGIASLRYDKRGIGKGISAAEKDLRFEHYVDDAVFWGEYLRLSGRFGKLIIIGHSEGALIGSIAAGKLKADAFISLAGAGRPAYKVIEEQFANIPAFRDEVRKINEHLRKGETVDSISPELTPAFRPEIQPYVISWYRYDPAEIVAGLKMPVLIIQGTTDIQVGVTDAEILAKANKKARLEILQGVNHVLKDSSADMKQQKQSYTDPSYPVSLKITDAVTLFIKELR